MAKNKNKQTLENYMSYVEDFLKEKYGNEIPAVWNLSLIQLRDYLKIYLEASEDVLKRGITVQNRFEEDITNPNLNVMKDASSKLDRLIKSFGLDLYSAKKINSDDTKNEDMEALNKIMMVE